MFVCLFFNVDYRDKKEKKKVNCLEIELMDYEPFEEAVIWKDLADSKIFKPRVTKMKGSLLKQPVKVLKARQS